jgi:FkbM family methyltransferase
MVSEPRIKIFNKQMKQTNIGRFKVLYRENTSDEEVIDHSFDNDIFFKSLYEYSPGKMDFIIDVGAHIGTFSLLAATKVSAGKVFSFEPCGETFELLKNNLELNNSLNVTPYKQALSGHTGQARLYYDSDYGNWGHTISKNISDKGEDVETISITDFFRQEKINKCNLIKFNCEGAEFDIILSTPPSILKNIENMLILYHEDLAEGRSHMELIKYLEENKFYIHLINQSNNPPRGWLIAYKGGPLKRLFIKIKCVYFRRMKPYLSGIKSKLLK